MRYPVPNRRNEISYGSGPVVPYKLSDVEMAYLAAGALDKIPTAEDRGLPVSSLSQSVIIRPEPTKKPRARESFSWTKRNVSAEELRKLRAEGLTVKQMAERLEIPAGTVGTLLIKYGIAGHKRGPRKRGGAG